MVSTTDKTQDRVRECAQRLVEHADFKLGGALSADSKAKDIPSNACSQVKARHLAALRDALVTAPPAAPAPEPVAIVSGYYGGQCVILPTEPARLFNSGTAFYTTPPAAQRQWVGLSHEEVMDSWDEIRDGDWAPDFYAVIEAKLKEKNT